MRLAVRSKVTHNYPGKTIWSSIKLALEHGSVHIWLKEVLLKAHMIVKGAVPCTSDGCYDMTKAGNYVKKVDPHCVVPAVCESVTNKHPWGKIGPYHHMY